jgi:hypothetical protein
LGASLPVCLPPGPYVSLLMSTRMFVSFTG